MPSKVVIYSTKFCPYCMRAKEFFKQQNIPFEEIDLSENFEKMEELKTKTGHRTVPQIFIGDTFIGGYTDLIAKYNSGEIKFEK